VWEQHPKGGQPTASRTSSDWSTVRITNATEVRDAKTLQRDMVRGALVRDMGTCPIEIVAHPLTWFLGYAR